MVQGKPLIEQHASFFTYGKVWLILGFRRAKNLDQIPWNFFTDLFCFEYQ